MCHIYIEQIWNYFLDGSEGKEWTASKLSIDCFLKKWANPASFSFIFGLFKQTSLQFLQQIYVKKMSIQYTVSRIEPTTFGTWVSSHNH